MSDLLQQKNLIEGYLARQDVSLSAFSFVNIFAWKDFFHFEIRIVHDNLCLFADNGLGCFLYFPPVGGQFFSETVHDCFLYMEKQNGRKGVSRMENVSQEILSLLPEDDFEFVRKGYEYVYDKKDIIDLKGNNYKSKRSSYNHFIKHYSYQFMPYVESMREGCLGLYRHWAQERRAAVDDPVYHQMLEENLTVHDLVMRYHDELGLIGYVVMIDGAIQAYTFGFALDEQTFCIFNEIANRLYSGLAVFIFREFCKTTEMAKFSFINAMDDVALDNMTRVKMSFHPTRLYPSYIVKKRDKQ